MKSPDTTPVASRPLSGLSGGASVAHTPGPWYSEAAAKDGRPNGALVFAHAAAGNRIRIAAVGNMGSAHAEDEANAARIVACVNACEGLDNQQVATLRADREALIVARYGKPERELRGLIDSAAALRAQRDELAKVLEQTANALSVAARHAHDSGREGLFSQSLFRQAELAFNALAKVQS